MDKTLKTRCIVARDRSLLYGYLTIATAGQTPDGFEVVIDRRAGARHAPAGAPRPGTDRRTDQDLEAILYARGYALLDGDGRALPLASPADRRPRRGRWWMAALLLGLGGLAAGGAAAGLPRPGGWSALLGW